jgi:hypothetical protein
MTPLGSCFPNNMVEGLIPPPGTGWRGSTLETLGAIEAEYNVKFDSKLQLYRIFAGAGWADLEPNTVEFVKSGGIVFYSVYDLDWADIAAGKKDWAINAYIAAFKAVYPAKMFVTMTFEPELAAEGNHAGRDNGPGHTSADFRAQWIFIYNKFKEAGVTNAVWAMDYSTETTFAAGDIDAKGHVEEGYMTLAASLWPGGEYVDWMFMNIFTYGSTRGWSFDRMLGQQYGNFVSHSNVPQEWMGETYTVDFMNKPDGTPRPWGLGAWGAGGVLPFRMIDETDRINFITGAEEALNSGKYPKLALSIYFDSTDGVTGMTCEIGNATWGRGAPGSTTDFTTVSNLPMFEAYKHFISSPFFSANDMPCTVPSEGIYYNLDCGVVPGSANHDEWECVDDRLELKAEAPALATTAETVKSKSKAFPVAGAFAVCAAAAVAVGAMLAAKARRDARTTEPEEGKPVEMF